MKFNATDLSKFEQMLLDIAIKAGVAAALVVLNFVSAALTNGSLQLPYPALTLPALSLVLSQLDSYFVNYQANETTE